MNEKQIDEKEDFDSWLNKKLQKQQDDKTSKGFCDNCGKELDDSNSYNYKTKHGNELKLCTDCYDNYIFKDSLERDEETYSTTNTTDKEPYNIHPSSYDTPSKKSKKFIIAFIVLLLFCFVSIYSTYHFYNYNNQLSDEIEFLSSEITDSINNTNKLKIKEANLESLLSEYTGYLSENESELSNIVNGDEFSLHNPIFSELSDFIKNDNSTDAKSLIENAKKTGIRCAYTEVDDPTGAYILVGFDTIDEGMVYFEPETDYRVTPVIGSSYVTCVEGSPYYSIGDDTIEDIKLFW